MLKSDWWVVCSYGSGKVMTGADFRGSFQFGSRSAKVLMKSDTSGDGNENSEYQLLMKSLACQLQTGDNVHCALSTVVHHNADTCHLSPSWLNTVLKDFCSGASCAAVTAITLGSAWQTLCSGKCCPTSIFALDLLGRASAKQCLAELLM